MTVIFFLRDDFKWTKETSKKVYKYFYEIVGTHEAVILLENELFLTNIQTVLKKFSIINKRIKIKKLTYVSEEDYSYIIENSGLLLLDKNRMEEIAYKYIPYSYEGKFIYLN